MQSTWSRTISARVRVTVADQDFKYGGEYILSGFLVIKEQWVQYVNTDMKEKRTYKLLPGECFLNIN